MTAQAASSHPVTPVAPAPPAAVSGQPWLAAVAVVPVLATVYQTLVLTDLTDDVIRKGIDAEHYCMILTNVCWGITVLCGVFAGISAMVAANMVAHWNADFFFVLMAAGGVGGLVAVLVGLPALRIKGMFLGVTTLA